METASASVSPGMGIEPCWRIVCKELSCLWPVMQDLGLCYTASPRHWRLPARTGSARPRGWRGIPFPPKRKPPVGEPVSRQGCECSPVAPHRVVWP